MCVRLFSPSVSLDNNNITALCYYVYQTLIKLGAGVYNWFKGEIIIFAVSDALKWLMHIKTYSH